MEETPKDLANEAGEGVLDESFDGQPEEEEDEGDAHEIVMRKQLSATLGVLPGIDVAAAKAVALPLEAAALGRDVLDVAASQVISREQMEDKSRLAKELTAMVIDTVYYRRSKVIAAHLLRKFGPRFFPGGVIPNGMLRDIYEGGQDPMRALSWAVGSKMLEFAANELTREAYPDDWLAPPVLHIFGSSGNSFGGPSADMDMAIEMGPGLLETFSPEPPGGGRGGAGGGKKKKTKFGASQAVLSVLKSAAHSMCVKMVAAATAAVETSGGWRAGTGAREAVMTVPAWTSIEPVFWARIPLIKLHHVSGLSIDLSINNLNGAKNTALLRTYAGLDDRVVPLVLAVKQWGKSNMIANAADHASFSSYTHTLLTIFFLQHCAGVLPSLQDPELMKEWRDHLRANTSSPSWSTSSRFAYPTYCHLKERQERGHLHPPELDRGGRRTSWPEDQWDDSFCDDAAFARDWWARTRPKRLANILWPQLGHMAEGDGEAALAASLGRLMSGYFLYYGRVFNPLTQVPCIKAGYPLARSAGSSSSSPSSSPSSSAVSCWDGVYHWVTMRRSKTVKLKEVEPPAWRWSVRDPLEFGRDLGTVMREDSQYRTLRCYEKASEKVLIAAAAAGGAEMPGSASSAAAASSLRLADLCFLEMEGKSAAIKSASDHPLSRGYKKEAQGVRDRMAAGFVPTPLPSYETCVKNAFGPFQASLPTVAAGDGTVNTWKLLEHVGLNALPYLELDEVAVGLRLRAPAPASRGGWHPPPPAHGGGGGGGGRGAHHGGGASGRADHFSAGRDKGREVTITHDSHKRPPTHPSAHSKAESISSSGHHSAAPEPDRAHRHRHGREHGRRESDPDHDHNAKGKPPHAGAAGAAAAPARGPGAPFVAADYSTSHSAPSRSDTLKAPSGSASADESGASARPPAPKKQKRLDESKDAAKPSEKRTIQVPAPETGGAEGAAHGVSAGAGSLEHEQKHKPGKRQRQQAKAAKEAARLTSGEGREGGGSGSRPDSRAGSVGGRDSAAANEAAAAAKAAKKRAKADRKRERKLAAAAAGVREGDSSEPAAAATS